MSFRRRDQRDASIIKTKALPASAGNVTSDAVVLRPGKGTNTHFHQECDIEIAAPALTVTELPNSATVTYDLIASNNADLSSPVTIQAGIIVQTGADGAGAAAKKAYYTPPADAYPYYGVKATTATSPGDCSGKSMSIDLLF